MLKLFNLIQAFVTAGVSVARCVALHTTQLGRYLGPLHPGCVHRTSACQLQVERATLACRAIDVTHSPPTLPAPFQLPAQHVLSSWRYHVGLNAVQHEFSIFAAKQLEGRFSSYSPGAPHRCLAGAHADAAMIGRTTMLPS